MKMSSILLLSTTLMFVSCETHGGPVFVGGSTTAPTTPATVQIFPQTLPFPVVTPACPFGRSFTVPLSLVIVAPTQLELTMNAATFRLIDGTLLGGPSITIPSGGLASTFGSTAVLGTGTFVFSPNFGCVVVQPLAIGASVVLTDSAGNTKNVSVSANLR